MSGYKVVICLVDRFWNLFLVRIKFLIFLLEKKKFLNVNIFRGDFVCCWLIVIKDIIIFKSKFWLGEGRVVGCWRWKWNKREVVRGKRERESLKVLKINFLVLMFCLE